MKNGKEAEASIRLYTVLPRAAKGIRCCMCSYPKLQTLALKQTIQEGLQSLFDCNAKECLLKGC